ncbi:MAG: polyprenyl synthetase family protein [Acidobacteria bacterium]|nr:polyprenyl synthetase family protein [Acidobacteriota bacterium]MCA1649283.1 polyprenyl synthetase family protein [Acidobacteriota bacterium]
MTLPLDAWLSARRQAVDAALDRFLPSPGPTPPIVCEAMRYTLFAGGKRVRPMLVLAAAEAAAPRTGMAEDEALALALPAACAVELVHTYSLVHDDLPAMDDDSMRRGRPTAHVVYGEGMAILAGDALLTEAFALMAREPASSDPGLAQRKLHALRVVGEAAGAAGMVGGQAIDLQAARTGAHALDADALSGMHARKTGALIRGSACAGGIMAGAAGPLLEAIDEYARHLGLAFQIVDDILDVEGASAELGKTAGKDAAAGKPTYPARYGLDESRRLAAECGHRALAALEPVQVTGQLPAIVRWVLGRTD